MNWKEFLVLGVFIYFSLKIAYRLFLRKYNWKRWYQTIYLRSYHWKFLRWRKRKWMSIITRGNVRCEKCGSKIRLQFHHVTYERLGYERLSDLQIICQRCHRKGSGRI